MRSNSVALKHGRGSGEIALQGKSPPFLRWFVNLETGHHSKPVYTCCSQTKNLATFPIARFIGRKFIFIPSVLNILQSYVLVIMQFSLDHCQRQGRVKCEDNTVLSSHVQTLFYFILYLISEIAPHKKKLS